LNLTLVESSKIVFSVTIVKPTTQQWSNDWPRIQFGLKSAFWLVKTCTCHSSGKYSNYNE